MQSCNKCKKEKEILLFTENSKNYKTCLECRTKSRVWRENNKKTVSLYNKVYNNNNKNINTEIIYIYAKLANANDGWIKFNSQLEAAKTLNLHAANINKVLKGNLKTTGGYTFMQKSELQTIEQQNWEEIKKENNIKNNCKNHPAKHRVLHETIENIIGKKCCNCKNWKPLLNYNYCKTHWDYLRNDCKDCISLWRKKNRKIINDKYKKYEKIRKAIDPKYKLLKTLRNRINTVLKYQNTSKTNSTINLTGCTLTELKLHLESKFKPGMNWNNHGKWHIDHIIPCSLFNLIDENEQKKCFNYTNLQPLWAHENLSKGNKLINN